MTKSLTSRMLMTMSDDNLPAKIGSVDINLPDQVFKHSARIDEVSDFSLQWDKLHFSRLIKRWSSDDLTIQEEAMLMTLGNRQIKELRDHLLMPNAYQNTKEKNTLLYPLD